MQSLARAHRINERQGGKVLEHRDLISRRSDLDDSAHGRFVTERHGHDAEATAFDESGDAGMRPDDDRPVAPDGEEHAVISDQLDGASKSRRLAQSGRKSAFARF